MQSKNIIQASSISFSYGNEKKALDEVSLTIPRGKKTVFLGPNGSGKSTLFLHFNGVLKPDSGHIEYEGQKISYNQKELARLRSEVSLVFQNPDDQIFSSTVEEDVAFGPMNMGIEAEEIERRVADALSMVEMQNYAERPTSQLSFGQRKRVALAGALAMKPKVLIMDEPTAGLDPEMVHELLELSEELNHKGVTVAISTHDVETAYEWADEVKVLCAGKLEFSGDPDELFARDDIHKFGLSAPMAYHLNEQMHLRTGLKEAPRPRSFCELAAKAFPARSKKVGTLRLACINEGWAGAEQKKALGSETESHKHTGIYGSLARRLAHEGKIDAHHTFHALEHGLLAASMGEDFTIFIEPGICGIVEKKAKRLEERSGIRINLLHEHEEKEG